MPRRRGRFCAAWVVVCAAAGIPTQASGQEIQINTPDHNSTDIDNSTTQSETSHAAFGNTIVAAWNDSSEFAATGLGGLTSLQGYAYSVNGGVSFVDAGFFTPPAGWTLTGDPSVVVDGTGTFYMASMAKNGGIFADSYGNIVVAQSTSISPAVVFGVPVVVPRLNATGVVDKEFIAVDQSGGAYDGRVYVAWSEFVGSQARLVFSRSTSVLPLTFSPAVQLSPADTAVHQGTMPFVGPAGELYVVWGRFTFVGGSVTNQEIHIVKSTDGGATFFNPDAADPAATKLIVAPDPAADFMATGGESVRTRGFPYISVDATPVGSATRGNVYVVYQADSDGAGPDRGDVFFARSTDGGGTWSNPRNITSSAAVTIGRDSTDNDNWQPSIATSPVNGQITVTFYDRREDTTNADGDPANMKVRVWKAISTDTGLTWCNEALSSTSFVPEVGYDPLINSTYMGDYIWGTADAGGFRHTWADCRNTVAPPGGAPSPPSPVGRPDQDVFYVSQAALSGPDLFIKPWGVVTGEGPSYKSPDIFVVDAMGVEVNATKGQVNKLRARVKNIGDAAATNVDVTFKFAPWFAGITSAALKTIGTVSADFVAGETKIIPIAWDLTDLTDTNGGAWPNPISDFTHFCMKVEVSHPSDVNLCNNNAQNNFTDVPTDTTTSFARFLVGNPLKKGVRARLIARLPKGYRAKLEGLGVPFGEPVWLKPGEIRVATITFEPPPAEGRLVTEDLVAEIDFEIEGEILGGLSARLAKADKQKRDVTRRYQAPARDVFAAVLKMLEQRKQPVSLANREKLMINTGSIPIDARRLRAAAAKTSEKLIARRQGGRYLATFYVKQLAARSTEVRIVLLLLADAPVDSPLGGITVISNGSIEKAYLDELGEILGR